MDVNVEDIVREYIDKTIHLSLATTTGNKPWVCEVHFAYDNDLNIYFRSLTSRRHSQEISQNQNVAGDIIDKYGVGEPVVGLYFEGQAEIMQAGVDQNLAAECLAIRLNANKEAILNEAKNETGHQFYKISVDNWYAFGRFGGDSGLKHTLAWGNK